MDITWVVYKVKLLNFKKTVHKWHGALLKNNFLVFEQNVYIFTTNLFVCSQLLVRLLDVQLINIGIPN